MPITTEQARVIGRAGGRAKKLIAIERRIRELVDTAPPLTPEQRDRLVVLLRGKDAS